MENLESSDPIKPLVKENLFIIGLFFLLPLALTILAIPLGLITPNGPVANSIPGLGMLMGISFLAATFFLPITAISFLIACICIFLAVRRSGRSTKPTLGFIFVLCLAIFGARFLIRNVMLMKINQVDATKPPEQRYFK